MRSRGFRISRVPAWAVATVPTVMAISPAVGDIAGGDSVEVTLDSTAGVTAATVGGLALTGLVVVSNRIVRGFTAAHASGATDVTATNTTGTGTLPGGFTYTGVVATFHILTEAAQGLLAENADNLRTE